MSDYSLGEHNQDEQQGDFQSSSAIFYDKVIHEVTELRVILERDIENQAQNIVVINERLEKVTRQLEEVVIQTSAMQNTVLALQKRNGTVEKLVKALDKLLEEKVEERKTFFEQLSRLRQDIYEIKNKNAN